MAANRLSYYEDTEDIDRFLVVYRAKGTLYVFDCVDDKWATYKSLYWKYLEDRKTVDYTDYKLAGKYISLYEDKVNFPEGIKRDFIMGTFELKLGKRL